MTKERRLIVDLSDIYESHFYLSTLRAGNRLQTQRRVCAWGVLHELRRGTHRSE